ncbi:Cu2+-exporting ATPase [Alkalibacterium putridalgicola]|uniref:P-type Cu(+) transporter n=1 Tax=Alkalibacterium putridalgicola TaxID=426703 RepID=A0A1H7WCR2_9LACT|nr:heavy metal translocating P-type ATPase [Alkalibacterium putridalgicola]SEM19382.1 Cu2+-exporting ATPase [Alkalibacterium putridalgicola]
MSEKHHADHNEEQEMNNHDQSNRSDHEDMNHEHHDSEGEGHHGHAAHGGHEGHHDHHAHMVEDFKKRFWISLVISVPIAILAPMLQHLFGFEVSFPGSDLVLFALATFVFFYGGKPFLTGLKSEVIDDHTPGMMTLISLAITTSYVYSTLTTFFIEGSDFYFELATLIVVMLLGHWIEMRSQMGASKALEELINLMPNDAHKLDEDGNTTDVSVEELHPGDKILVKSGEKVPLDGKILEGSSSIDESMLTGESVPVEKKEGQEVIGGSINGEGVLTVEVSKVGEETYLSQVVDMVRNAQATKSKAQGFADKAAKWLFYVALGAGLLTMLYWVNVSDFEFALERTVTVLIIACPHALGLAMPLVSSVSTSIAAQKGLLIRNRTQFESARTIDKIVFDKTGTLTEGTFGVDAVIPEDGISEKDLLQLAYSVESQSDHPIAKGIVREGEEKNVQRLGVTDYNNLTGKGLEAKIAEDTVSVLSPGAMKEEGITFDEDRYNDLSQQGKTVVFVLKNKKLQGMIALSDIIRESSYKVIRELTEMGIDTVMITGDNQRVADGVGKELGLTEVIAEVLPDQKSEHIKRLQEDGSQQVAMVGDGINDAPALAAADIGIAIGAGTDVAIETADVILVNSDPRDVLNALNLSKATHRKNIQNLWWAAGYNIIAIPLAAGILYYQGIIITPAIGAAVMSLSTVIVAVNARLLSMDDESEDEKEMKPAAESK